MMASPELLEEFAVGFSLSERIIPDISHIYDIQVKEGCGNGLVVEWKFLRAASSNSKSTDVPWSAAQAAESAE